MRKRKPRLKRGKLQLMVWGRTVRHLVVRIRTYGTTRNPSYGLVTACGREYDTDYKYMRHCLPNRVSCSLCETPDPRKRLASDEARHLRNAIDGLKAQLEARNTKR